MELNTERIGDALVASLDGRLDGSNSRAFEEAMNAEIGDSGCSIVVDFANLTYISSAGLRAILLIAKALGAKKSKLVLCCLSERIEEVFSISGFNKILSICTTREEALASIQ